MFTRHQFPDLKPIEVRRINSLLDNRAHPFLDFPEYDVLGIRRGHRKKKHDIVSAATIGSRVAGTRGMQAAIFHTMLDKMSDNLEQQFGSEQRDILMSCWKIAMGWGHKRGEPY